MNKQKPIIIGGCPRSGTTLIRRVLNNHSKIYCGSEIKFFEDFFNDYQINDTLKNIRFFNTARNIVSGDELISVFGKCFIHIHEIATQNSGKSRWADKCPSNVIYLKYWEELLNGNFVFIHAVRNPLDTIASLKEMAFNKSIPIELDKRIDFYNHYLQSGLYFSEKSPDKSYILIYEKIINSPENTLRELMRFLNEEFENNQLVFDEIGQTKNIEDPKINKTQTIHNNSFGRWQNILTKKEAVIIWEKCHRLWSKIDPHFSFIEGIKNNGEIDVSLVKPVNFIHKVTGLRRDK